MKAVVRVMLLVPLMLCQMVVSAAEFEQACEMASKRAFSGRIIVEEFLCQVGSSSDTDCFSIDNELVFCSFNCQP
jgi:hypothetical protein